MKGAKNLLIVNLITLGAIFVFVFFVLAVLKTFHYNPFEHLHIGPMGTIIGGTLTLIGIIGWIWYFSFHSSSPHK